MAITVFARIRREHLREMYLSYCYTGRQGGDGACSEKVLGLVALYARAALLDLVAETRTEDFFRERVRIIEAMTDVVREAVAPLHMEIFMLNLREVVFDEEVGAAAVLRVASACGQGRLDRPLVGGSRRGLLRTEGTHCLSGGRARSLPITTPCDTLRYLAITSDHSPPLRWTKRSRARSSRRSPSRPSYSSSRRARSATTSTHTHSRRSTKYEVASTHDAWLRPPHCPLTTGDLRVTHCY